MRPSTWDTPTGPVLGCLYEGSCYFGLILVPEFWKLPYLGVLTFSQFTGSSKHNNSDLSSQEAPDVEAVSSSLLNLPTD